MEISRRVTNGGKKSCTLGNVKTILLLLGESEIIQYGDMFFFRDLAYRQAAAKICISGQADSLHNLNIINSHHRLDLRYLSLYQISNFILV